MGALSELELLAEDELPSLVEIYLEVTFERIAMRAQPP
jgi:hypothetical protein